MVMDALKRQITFLLGALLLLTAVSVKAERLLDIVDIQGVRNNPLIGYGLVVGLNGTGDKSTSFTDQSLKNLLREFGISQSDEALKSKNVAAVSIHATLTPFVRPGQRIDISVSSLGDAKSLSGGTLLMSSLKGIDGEVYAIAQGELVIGGAGASGLGASVIINTLTVGRIPNGAIVERGVPSNFIANREIVLNLRDPGFSTARRIVQEINHKFGSDVARARDSASIAIAAPPGSSERVTFMAVLENLAIEVATPPARVIFNSRTGTVVIGQNVTVLPAAVSHGSLIVTIKEGGDVSQPEADSLGETVVIPDTEVTIEQQGAMFMLPEKASLQDIISAINSVGASPSDLMSILQALKQAGVLRAELIVI